MLYVIDSSKSNEKMKQLKGWFEFHIDEAFKAAEITDSDVQCESICERIKIILLISNMTSFVSIESIFFFFLYYFVFVILYIMNV